MTKLEFAQQIADNAKDDYIQKLKQADSALRAEVSRDPSTLPAAIAVQATYSEGIVREALSASQQPGVEPESEPEPEPESEPVQDEPPTVVVPDEELDPA